MRYFRSQRWRAVVWSAALAGCSTPAVPDQDAALADAQDNVAPIDIVAPTDVAAADATTDATAGADVAAGASVVQHHAHANRDGLYVAPALTLTSAKTLHMDATFVAPIAGPTYAQPLYLPGGPGGKDVLIVATEQNVVYALDSATGTPVWQTPALGVPVPLAALKQDPGCGNINPLGVTGTPYADLATRRIFLDAMTTPDGGKTKHHKVFALSLDDGSVLPGWPVDLDTALANAAPAPFVSKAQNQRGALLVQGGILYVPFGGHDGDCGNYRGWVVGIDVGNPTTVVGWATPGLLGGIWAPNGVSSDGVSLYATSGNTAGATSWSGGEAVLRFSRGPVFSGATQDFFSPANWLHLDQADLDLGGAAALLVDVPGATPANLVVAMGKDRKVYLLDRGNLGGIGHELLSQVVATNEINAAPTTWHTDAGAFIAFRIANGGTGVGCPNGRKGNLVALRIDAGAPPSVSVAWCSVETDLASPITSVIAASGADAIVWAISSNRLIGYNASTGEEVFAGGKPSDVMTTVQYFQTPIVVNGRVFVAAHNRLYAFAP